MTVGMGRLAVVLEWQQGSSGLSKWSAERTTVKGILVPSGAEVPTW